MKLFVNKEFWDVFPEGQLNILVVKGVDNTVGSQEYLTKLLKDSIESAGEFVKEEDFAQNKVVKEWRTAFSEIKTKEGARSSIEILLEKVAQGKEFKTNNPLVDLCNSVSLAHGVPCNGEDLENIEGDLVLGIAKGGEGFVSPGSEENDPVLPGEMIYFDEIGAVCRSLNWQEAQRTIVTESTQNAIFVIESTSEEEIKRANEAILELKHLIDSYFDATSEVSILNKKDSSLEL